MKFVGPMGEKIFRGKYTLKEGLSSRKGKLQNSNTNISPLCETLSISPEGDAEGADPGV